ncbi:tetratricopeptide repeat protein [Desulfovibrionales bacterium]
METTKSFPAPALSKVVWFVLAGLIVLVFSTIVYRVEHPSLVQHEERRQMPGGDMEKMGGMGNISALMQKLQDHPEDVETMRALGMAFMDMQAWEKSQSFWDMLLKKDAHDVVALNQKGICLFELKRYAEAAEQFEHMLGIEPHNYHAHYNLGILYKHYLEQPDKAVIHFQTVIDAQVDDAELLESAKRELGANK